MGASVLQLTLVPIHSHEGSMPYKARNTVFDLGTVTADGYSAEADLSSFTHAVLYIDPDSSWSSATPSFNIFTQCSPTPFGETAAWYDLKGKTFQGGTADIPIRMMFAAGTPKQARLIPNGHILPSSIPYLETSSTTLPRRLRWKVEDVDCALKLECMRMIS